MSVQTLKPVKPPELPLGLQNLSGEGQGPSIVVVDQWEAETEINLKYLQSVHKLIPHITNWFLNTYNFLIYPEKGVGCAAFAYHKTALFASFDRPIQVMHSNCIPTNPTYTMHF